MHRVSDPLALGVQPAAGVSQGVVDGHGYGAIQLVEGGLARAGPIPAARRPPMTSARVCSDMTTTWPVSKVRQRTTDG
jgi:hypothetical protein